MTDRIEQKQSFNAGEPHLQAALQEVYGSPYANLSGKDGLEPTKNFGDGRKTEDLFAAQHQPLTFEAKPLVFQTGHTDLFPKDNAVQAGQLVIPPLQA